MYTEFHPSQKYIGGGALSDLPSGIQENRLLDFRTTNRPFLQNTVPVVQGFPVGEGRGLVSPDFGIGQAEAFLIVRRAIVVLSREKRIFSSDATIFSTPFSGQSFSERIFSTFSALQGKVIPKRRQESTNLSRCQSRRRGCPFSTAMVSKNPGRKSSPHPE